MPLTSLITLLFNMPKTISYRVWFLLSIVFLPLMTHAVQVDELYRADVKVVAQSVKSQQKAIRQGLLSVLVKVTGRSQVSSIPAIKNALANSTAYLSDYRYVRQDATGAMPAQLMLRVNYSESVIDQLIRTAQLPIWPAERPEVLVWLVTDLPGEGAQYAGDELLPEIAQFVKLQMQARGIPYVEPLLDLEDQLVMPAKSAWAFNSVAMSGVAERYGVKNWAIIRFYKTANGQLRGDTYVQAGPQHELRAMDANTMDQLIKKGVDFIGDQVALGLGFVQHESAVGFPLSLEGIQNNTDYTAAMKYFNGLKMVADVQIVKVDGSRLQLDLKLDGSEEVFLETVRRERRLMEVVDFNNQSTTLRFDWQP